MEIKKRFLTQTEAIELLRTSPATIIRWRKKNLINAFKIGGKVLYDVNEIERLINQN